MKLTKKLVESINTCSIEKVREIGKDSFKKEMTYTVDTPNNKLEQHYSEITRKCTKRIIELMQVSISDVLEIKNATGDKINKVFVIKEINDTCIKFTNGYTLDVLSMNLDNQTDVFESIYSRFQTVTISKALPQLPLRGTNFFYHKVYDTFLWSSHNDIKNDRQYSFIACLIDILVNSIDSIFFDSFVESYISILTIDFNFIQDEFDKIIEYANTMHELLNRGVK